MTRITSGCVKTGEKKNAIIIIILVFVVIIVYNEQRQQSIIEYGDITIQEAKKIIEKTPSLIILDVRLKEEYESGHIINAFNIPVEVLEDSICCIGLQSNDDILVYSNMGIKSKKAMEILIANSYTKIYNMKEGIRSWNTDDYIVAVNK